MKVWTFGTHYLNSQCDATLLGVSRPTAGPRSKVILSKMELSRFRDGVNI